MGLIYNKSLPKFIIGYPTMSDKYNVLPGVLDGATAVGFGDLVKFSSTNDGYYTAISSALSAITDVAGFVVATNAKMPLNWPGTTVQVNPGEAFGLLKDGFIATRLDDAATTSYIKNGAQVYIILATGKLTTSDKASAGTIVALTGYTFTGQFENQGTVASPIIVAEVEVK